VFVDGDPVPVGEDPAVPWSDHEVSVDRSRLQVGKRLVATQELGGVTSKASPDGATIEPAAFGDVTFVKPLYACGRSVLLRVQADPAVGAAAGSRVELWQGTHRLGVGTTVGTLCQIDFDPGQAITGGVALDVHQFLCTSGSPHKTSSKLLPVLPPLVPIRKMPPVVIDRPVEECIRLLTVRQVVPGAVLQLTWQGVGIFDRAVPLDQESVLLSTAPAVGDEITAEQSMVNCEFTASDPDKATVVALASLPRPRIDGPLCAGPGKVTLSRLKPGATVILFADGVEIGRWEAPKTEIELDADVPHPPATLTAQQQLCGQTSLVSRGYTAASGRSGRWFLAEDAAGNDLKAEAFAVHAALAHTGQIVLFSGDQHNPAQAFPTPDLNHAELFDCQSLTVAKIDAPKTDAFCCGHALLPDGRLLMAGGTESFVIPPGGGFHHDHFPGVPNAWTFNPIPSPGPQHWAEAKKMSGGRWYPTLVTLRDGRVLALSGHPEEADTTRHNNDTMELFDTASGIWLNLGDSAEVHSNDRNVLYLYPRLHVLPGGDVFSSTPMPGLPGQTGRWTPGSGRTWKGVTGVAPEYEGFGTTAVLLPLLPDDKYRTCIAVAGRKDTHLIDFGTPSAPDPAPTWHSLGARSAVAADRVRVNCNAVLLPTAEVLIIGGVEDQGNDDTAVLDPELLRRDDSGAWKWSSTKLAPATVVRNYHSTALLMPDGRVWTSGGNIKGAPGGPSVRHLEVEIYEPWYCCLERPEIHEWPTQVHAGHRVLVRVRSRHPIQRLALLRAGSATHAFNPDQRYIGLTNVVHESNDLYIGEVPPSDITIPGYYLLFACTKENVPSPGVFTQILP
jgi:hypothetical protein